MSRPFFAATFATGLLAVAWVAASFVNSRSWLALAVTAVIAAVYLLGAFELRQFRAATRGLADALAAIPQPLPALSAWLERVPPALRNAVRLRVEGERTALPAPALTPYLVGLLVMLGMLGTFLGMVVTFQGAVFALEGSTDLQAIRSALAEPIKGLGLSFGTSVAGVAASAMLGLMSAIARRERLETARSLDGRIATELQAFSLVHQRQEALRALQAQAGALPAVAERLEVLMERIEQRSQQLDERLAQRQEQFHREVGVAYTGLAANVGRTLQDSLAASARAAGESITPAVDAAMTRIVRESQALHERLGQAAQAQAEALGRSFEQRSAGLLADLQERLAAAQAAQAAAECERREAWTQSLQSVAGALQDQWRRIGEETGAQQREVAQLLHRSDDLLRARTATEAEWLAQQRERMDQLAGVWQQELAALRREEGARGEAAVARLGELQASVAQHLATLGAALEAPITRLLHTASEVPQAAAGVIAQLREEMSRVAERDNLALRERTELLQQLGTLLQAVNQAAGDQRAAVEGMLGAATATLEQAGARFAEALAAQAAQAGEVSAQVGASAVELASLAEGFQHAVQQFQDSSGQLAATLQAIEASLQRSTARSDEQLAYYVAQAREVIDLSISSQQGLVEHIQKIQVRPATPAAPAGGRA